MTDAFRKTLDAAESWDGVADLLFRSSAHVPGADADALRDLSRRYRDYATAMRECVPVTPPDPADDQAPLF